MSWMRLMSCGPPSSTMRPESVSEPVPEPEPPDSSAPGDEVPGPSVAAVLLAGGRGSRLGGVEKGLLTRDGVPLITGWAEALGRRDIPAVVVGTPSCALTCLPGCGSPERTRRTPVPPQRCAPGSARSRLTRGLGICCCSPSTRSIPMRPGLAARPASG
ncbi:hypothetical protein BCY76_007645 [Nesterenkonia sp. PF2B19]|nr:hypothetical protein BCY76_007645 [Nesterenkonia sp. PF2B19]